MLISFTIDGGDNYYYKNDDGDGDGDCDGNDNDGDDVGDDGNGDDDGGGGGDGDGVDEKPREIWWLCPHATSGRPFTNNSSPLACHDHQT